MVIKEIIFANTPLNFLGLLCNNDEMINKMEKLIEEIRELEMCGFISYEELIIWTNNIERHIRSCGDRVNKISYHTTNLHRMVM